MRILIAEDDGVTRKILEQYLTQMAFEVVVTHNGQEAAAILLTDNAPSIAILDWNMPGMDGIDVCRLLRSERPEENLYMILLTGNTRKEQIIEGLGAGANDYVTKPFDAGELYARLLVGTRIMELRKKLQDRVTELTEALNRVKQLQGLLPICCYCKRIRSDEDYWQQVEHYIADHTDARFTHGICPACYEVAIRQAGIPVKSSR